MKKELVQEIAQKAKITKKEAEEFIFLHNSMATGGYFNKYPPSSDVIRILLKIKNNIALIGDEIDNQVYSHSGLYIDIQDDFFSLCNDINENKKKYQKKLLGYIPATRRHKAETRNIFLNYQEYKAAGNFAENYCESWLKNCSKTTYKIVSSLFRKNYPQSERVNIIKLKNMAKYITNNPCYEINMDYKDADRGIIVLHLYDVEGRCNMRSIYTVICVAVN